jgi:hypothetical protein
MLTEIPNRVADLITADALGKIIPHYEASPDPDRVYVIDAPGGVVGNDIVTRAGWDIEPDCPAVWGWYPRDWARRFLAHDRSERTRHWLASDNMKVLTMVDTLMPRMCEVSRAPF